MSDNGILAAVPGECVSAAALLLPRPETAQILEQQIEIDAGHAGRVRLFFKRQQVRHHKHSHFYWLAYHAQAVEDLGDAGEPLDISPEWERLLAAGPQLPGEDLASSSDLSFPPAVDPK